MTFIDVVLMFGMLIALSISAFAVLLGRLPLLAGLAPFAVSAAVGIAICSLFAPDSMKILAQSVAEAMPSTTDPGFIANCFAGVIIALSVADIARWAVEGWHPRAKRSDPGNKGRL